MRVGILTMCIDRHILAIARMLNVSMRVSGYRLENHGESQ